MKVLHTIRGLLKIGGGPSYTVPALAMAQVRAGATVHLLLDEDKYEYDPPDGVVVAHRSRLNVSLETYLSEYDIVHDHGVWLPCNHRIAKAARRARVPRVMSPRGALQDWIWNQRRWKKELGWLLYQKRDLLSADAVFVTADVERDQIKRLGYSSRIYELPNGVDAPGEMRKLWSADGRHYALFMARIHPKKGIEELIECWCKVAPSNWTLLVAGNDEIGLVAKLEKVICESSRKADVRFLGMLDGLEKARAFQQAELFVLPTHSENFGVSVIEAMLMGLPVITTTGTPWTNLGRDGIGWVINPERAALSACLDVALNVRKEQLDTMGQRAYEWAKGRFDWDAIAMTSLDYYAEIIKEKQSCRP